MAFNVSFRWLLFLLGAVVVLNITNLCLSANRQSQIKMPVLPFAFIEMQEAPTHRNIVDTDDLKSLFWQTKSIPTPTPITANAETCDVTDEADAEEEPKPCPQIPPGLGPEHPFLTTTQWLKNLLPGGYYKHHKCVAQQKLAVIVPYGGPSQNLIHFLYHLHPFLMKQQADYQVFVVDYANKAAPLTRGQLFNIGFMEAQKHSQWQCLLLHEPHLVPLDSRNLYRCNWYPKQLVAEIQMNQTSHKDYQRTPIGGVIALTPEQYSKVNGFSNRVSGKDYADYYNFYERLQWANYTLERNEKIIGKYMTLMEPITVPVNKSFHPSVSPFHLIDGLTTLDYELELVDYHVLMYTLIRVSGSQENSTNSNLLNVLLNRV